MNSSFRLCSLFLFAFFSVFVFVQEVCAQKGADFEKDVLQESEGGADVDESGELDSILKDLEKTISEKDSSDSFISLQHRFEGGINDLAIEYNTQKAFYVAGEDGFLSKVILPNFESETWQLSTLAIKKIATHPDGSTLATYESNGANVHKISVWNWKEKKRLFIIRPNYLVTALAWSANGNYLLVGNTEKGIEVFDKRGVLLPIYSLKPGIVLLATTGKRERSIVTYSKNGKLNYTSLKDKKKLAEYKTISALNFPHIIKNYTRIVGYSNGYVHILNAYTGEEIERYASRNAIFASHKDSEVAIWIEEADEKSNFVLHIGDKKKSSFVLPSSTRITSCISIDSKIILGLADGSLQVLKVEEKYMKCTPLFEYKNEKKIKDIVASKRALFMLRGDSLVAKNEMQGAEVVLKDGLDCTSLLCKEDALILWSEDEKKTVQKYSLITQKLTPLYKPKTNVRFCSIYNGNLLVLESSSLISIISIDDEKLLFSHTVEGAESALQRDSFHIIVSKNTLDATASPLLELNMQTKESAPVKLSGSFAFSLVASTELSNTFFCFLLDENSKTSTNLIQFATEENKVLTGRFEKLLTYEDEDFSSFILSLKGAVLTNLGKDGLIYFKLYEKRLFRLERFYALPKKAVIFAGHIVCLGLDGSIAYYNEETLKLEIRKH